MVRREVIWENSKTLEEQQTIQQLWGDYESNPPKGFTKQLNHHHNNNNNNDGEDETNDNKCESIPGRLPERAEWRSTALLASVGLPFDVAQYLRLACTCDFCQVLALCLRGSYTTLNRWRAVKRYNLGQTFVPSPLPFSVEHMRIRQTVYSEPERPAQQRYMRLTRSNRGNAHGQPL